ncbi:putative glutamine amidotransferase [Natronincola peptidivorans]|uniref:Putative glutamine amidotransferase n=1 Tax=Natronincola peptidivorans TaxID=426128 RepID=A0A1H9ZTI1_9FIRM|nr:type 1 glutamine amidotransferase [Natronincola peptidivorans]SES85073.1 putative glutamine amidotransferase [Natronincola peptidivorans]
MKKIAITQRLVENDSYYEIRDCLDVRWSSMLHDLGFLPIILPSQCNFNIYFNELKIDGIVFSGGNDLGDYSGKEIDKKRDVLEKQLIRYTINKNIPLLGVCRGMQIVGDYFGLTLEKVNGHAGERHEIFINEQSKYFKKLRGKKQVNSYHNFAFKKYTNDFTVIATSKDGIIEAMEHNNNKILLQMWHPEREEPFCKKDIALIKEHFTNV